LKWNWTWTTGSNCCTSILSSVLCCSNWCVKTPPEARVN
jgi:hypothetical protein